MKKVRQRDERADIITDIHFTYHIKDFILTPDLIKEFIKNNRMFKMYNVHTNTALKSVVHLMQKLKLGCSLIFNED